MDYCLSTDSPVRNDGTILNMSQRLLSFYPRAGGIPQPQCSGYVQKLFLWSPADSPLSAITQRSCIYITSFFNSKAFYRFLSEKRWHNVAVLPMSLCVIMHEQAGLRRHDITDVYKSDFDGRLRISLLSTITRRSRTYITPFVRCWWSGGRGIAGVGL
jgi:hypothetical protein